MNTKPGFNAKSAWNELYKLGYSLVPLGKDKKALVGWLPLQQVKATREQIRGWFDKFGDDINPGVVTGKVSGLFVLDVDGDNGEASLAKLGELPYTPRVATGKGKHYYFSYPNLLEGQRVATKAGIVWEGSNLDVRGDGGYVMAAGAFHPSGHYYDWQVSPLERELAAAPKWLLDLVIVEDRPEPVFTTPTVASAATDASMAWAEAALEGEMEKVRNAPDGYKHDRLYASAFAIGGLCPPMDAHRAVRDLYEAICDRASDKQGALRTIQDGIRGGQHKPREIPKSTANSRQAPIGVPPEVLRQQKEQSANQSMPQSNSEIGTNALYASVMAQEATETPEPHRWAPKPLSTLVARTESIEWLWEGYIAKGYITLFSAMYKVGKSTLLSWVLKHLDYSGASTLPQFIGLRTRPAKVLVISEEVERHWITRRDDLGLGDYVHLISKPFMLKPNKAAWESLCKHLGAEVALHDYQLVIFDTLPNLWAVKNENDNAEVQEALVPLNYIIEQGAGVVIVSHHKKNDGRQQHYDEGQATRGAGSIGGYVDIILEMRRFDVQSMSDTRRVLTALSRFEETPTEMVLDYTPGWGYASLGTKQDARREQRKATLKDLLPTEGDGMSIDEIVKEWPEEAETPRRSALASDLDYMAQVSMEVVRRGTGKKGEPYRYRRNNTERQYVAAREESIA